MMYDNEKKLQKAKGQDSKAYAEEMSRMLKEAEARLLGSSRLQERYRRAAETSQRENARLVHDRSRVISQLQSLFAVYNKQKKAIETMEREKEDLAAENKSLKAQLSAAEQANVQFRNEANRDAETRRDLVIRHNVLMCAG